jgi:hypothetical protein
MLQQLLQLLALVLLLVLVQLRHLIDRDRWCGC